MKKLLKKSIAVILAVTVIVFTSLTAFAFTSCTECGRIFESESDYSTHKKMSDQFKKKMCKKLKCMLLSERRRSEKVIYTV